MAMAPPTFSLSTNHQRTVCWFNNAKPISKCIKIPNPYTSMLSCCGFSTVGVQNSMAWNMESHRIIQAKDLQQRRRLRAVAEDTELVSEGTQEEQQLSAVVSQSDKLTMIFKADGTITESLVGKVSQTLQALEDVSDVKVETLEGITTVELVKQTTVQATGVASGLVEMLLGMDFKLQSLCLSFEDEEDDEGWV